jgi:nucleoside-diphosphate-sugar epimerase
MKVVVLGAGGKIGSEIVRALSPKHEIVRVGRNDDVKVDYTNASSVKNMFEQVGGFDALVVAVGGDSVFKVYEDLSDEDFAYGFQRKFMAQVNLVRTGTSYANDGASFTLSSGYLSDYPNPASVATAFTVVLHLPERKNFENVSSILQTNDITAPASLANTVGYRKSTV